MNEPATPPQWRIEMLGGLCARQRNDPGGASPVTSRFRTRKTGILLAYLACYKDRPPHAREILIDQIWPEADLTSGRNSLSIALSSLRHLLEPPGVAAGTVLAADRETVRLNPHAVQTDVADFERHLRAANENALRQAIALYQGELLPAYYEDWILAERRRLAEGFVTAVRRQVGLLRQRDNTEQALDVARQAVRLAAPGEPLPDDLTELLAELERQSRSRPFFVLPNFPVPPAGTVTFLDTDAPRERIENEVARHNGRETGEADGAGTIRFVFPRAGDALDAALAVRRVLRADCPQIEKITRVALHTSEIEAEKSRTGGLLAAAHNGQTLVSEATALLLRQKAADGAATPLTDLGRYRLDDDDAAAEQRLFQVDFFGDDSPRFGPPRARPVSAADLPRPLSRFFGRENEITRLRALLGGGAAPPQARLVTLTGAGGTGKTRLALETVRQLAETDFQGGIWFVPLADVGEPAHIAEAILTALRLPRRMAAGTEIEQVVVALTGPPQHPRRTLLVLDNFEHLAQSGGAFVVQSLLRRVPALACLVTSRQTLRLDGEQVFEIGSLASPESVSLFVDRARAVRADFQITPANADAVSALAERLEIPLALELAASRAQVLSLAQMLEQITTRRLDLLAGRGKPGTPARHQTLRNALDWSYELLSPHLRRFWEDLSVFRGGWSVEAAEAVTNEPLTLDYLAQLRECSLIQTEQEAHGAGEIRFFLLETLRDYAGERLAARADADATHARHLSWCVALAEAAEPELSEPNPAAWLRRLEREHENVRTALAWAQRCGNPCACLQIAAALGPFWDFSGRWAEARAVLTNALQAPCPAAAPGLRNRARRCAGMLSLRLGDHERAEAWLTDALAGSRAHSGDPREVARTLNALGILAAERGDFAQARAHHGEALALRRVLNEAAETAASLNNLGNIAYVQSEFKRSRALHEEALDLQKGVDDRRGWSISVNNLGNIAHSQGNDDHARALFEEALMLSREQGDFALIAQNLSNLGVIAASQGHFARAVTLHEESLALNRKMGSKYGVAAGLINLAVVTHSQRDDTRTQALYEESLVLMRELDHKSGIGIILNNLGNLARDAGDGARAHACYDECLLLRRDLGDTYHIASTLNNQALLARRENEPDRARALFEESLRLRREIGDRAGTADTLHGLALLVLDAGDIGASLPLLRESLALRRETGDREGGCGSLEAFARLAEQEHQEERRVTLLGAAAMLRTRLGISPAPPEHGDAAFLAGQALSWEQAVAYALEENTREENAKESP